MFCPDCKSGNIVRKGNRRLLNGWRQTYLCKECGRRFTPIVEERKEQEDKQGPRILFLDVETLPMTVFTWTLHPEHISTESIISPTFLLSWSAKWFGDKHISGDVLTTKEVREQTDRRLCLGIFDLLCKADLVVAFNGERFDFKKLNYRFIVNDFSPPTEYRTIDPIITLRSKFGFDSNKLDWTNQQLGLSRKTETTYQLWKDCFYGDADALHKMLEYNKQDVEILEQHYLKLRPWIKTHPNLGVYFEHEGEICRICGSTQLREVLDKFHYTNLGKYSLYRCLECGGESVGRKNELSKEKRDGLVK